MKKQIGILALILISGISLLQAQPVTGLTPADMKSIKSTGIEFSITREGNNLVVVANAATDYLLEIDGVVAIKARIKFTGNTRKESEALGSSWGFSNSIVLKMVDEATGKSFELLPDKNSDLSIIGHEVGHMYKFILNGKVIATGYKPK